MKKPPNLIYGVEDKPGWGTSVLLGIQHVCTQSVAFIFPVIIVGEIGGTREQAQALVLTAMVASGVATILQGLNRVPVGCGYLCPVINGPAFLSVSLMAGRMGGLPLIFGMTLVGGAFEALFSRIVTRMRAFFPAEVTGTVVTMVGIEIVSLSVPRFLGYDAQHKQVDPRATAVAITALAAMMGFSVWGRGKLRLYSLLLGLLVGYTLSAFAGLLTMDHVRQLLDAPLLTFPHFGQYGLSFNAMLVVPFLVATLSSALKAMGDITTCQKINDAEWKRPDMKSISRGILACSIGNVLSGLIGGLGQSASSSNIGLSIATGATSRRIAFTAGGALLVLAFVPKLAAIFTIMPTPVMGAFLVFAACFMIVAGIQIIMSRMLDARKTFVVGIAMIFGLSVEIKPDLYEHIHPWIKPLFSSALTLSTICAIGLNMLFRIGIARHRLFELKPGVDSSETVFNIMEVQGAAWGARREVIYKAASAINELCESLAGFGLARGPIQVDVSFDEFRLDVDLDYAGKLPDLTDEKVSMDRLLAGDEELMKLSGLMIRKAADKVTTEAKNGRCCVRLHFVH